MSSEFAGYEFSNTGLGASKMAVVSFRGYEALSRPFQFTIDLKSTDDALDSDALLAGQSTFKLTVGGKTREIHGILSECEELNRAGDYTLYRAVLVPRLWQLSLYTMNEVYLEQTVPDLVKTLLESVGLTTADYETNLLRDYREWPYRCQFAESHLDYLHRILEREGAYYYFSHTAGRDKVVFCDHRQFHHSLSPDTVSYNPATGMDASVYQDKVYSLVARQTRMPRKVILRDYYDETPSVDVRAEAEVDPNGVGEVYAYGDHLVSTDEAKELAQIRAEEILCGKRRFYGESAVGRFEPGFVFQLQDHFRDGFNRRYLLLGLEHEGREPSLLTEADETESVYRNTFTAIPADVQFRPAQDTPKPRFYGTLNARIDAEGDGQYAELDQQGRYKVILPFDLSRRQAGKASYWIRCMQPYGGEQEGAHFPLRKGAQVLLTFLGGDPDRPIINGAIPNASQISVVRAENQTNSRIQSPGGNLIDIEDREDTRRIKLFSPHKNSYMHLGAHNAKGNGVVTVTLGLERTEVAGGDHITKLTSEFYDRYDTGDLKDKGVVVGNGSHPDHAIFNVVKIHQFQEKDDDGKTKQNTQGKDIDLTYDDEITGKYFVTRQLGDSYTFSGGNSYTYTFGGDKDFTFGDDYGETHFAEDGIDAHNETFAIPDSCTGATTMFTGYGTAWDPEHHFVEKKWGDTYEYHMGHSYEWGDGNGYEFGIGYAEVHINLDSDNKPKHGHGLNYQHWEHDSHGSINPNSARIEKTFGDTYEYHNGDSREVHVGNSEEHVYGNSVGRTHGNSDEMFMGAKSEMTLAASNDMFLGVKNEWTGAGSFEVFAGGKFEGTLAGSIEVGLSAALEAAFGVKLTLHEAVEFELKEGHIVNKELEMEQKEAKIHDDIAEIASTVTKIGESVTQLSDKVTNLDCNETYINISVVALFL